MDNDSETSSTVTSAPKPVVIEPLDVNNNGFSVINLNGNQAGGNMN